MDADLKKRIEKLISSDNIAVTAGKFLLAAIAIGGMVYVGAASPRAYDMLRIYKRSRKYSKKQVTDAFSNLKRRNMIRIIEEKGGSCRVELTLEGRQRIKQFDFDKLAINPPKRWDGKWHVLIFDIPTTRSLNKARNALRWKIKELGFYRLQQSVWIHPYPCEEEILFVAESYNVQKYVEILTVDKLLHEKFVKSKFPKLNLR